MITLAIDTDELSRDFRGRRALDALTLQVPAGTVFGLLGPNGAGKTTTIRLLLGLLEPTSGTARVLGLDTRAEAGAIRARAGALLEHAGLYERLCAYDNLELYGRIARLSTAARSERIKGLLGHLGLWERRRDIVATWSRGMKQKLAIARAMLNRPELLFLDEPTAGLDPVAAQALRRELSELVARERVTVFLTTHHLAEAEELCEQVGVLKGGRLIAVGTPSEVRGGGGRKVEMVGRRFGEAVLAALRTRKAVQSVEASGDGMTLKITLAQGAEVSPLVALVIGHGGEVEEVRRGQASLDAAFHALVGEVP